MGYSGLHQSDERSVLSGACLAEIGVASIDARIRHVAQASVLSLRALRIVIEQRYITSKNQMGW